MRPFLPDMALLEAPPEEPKLRIRLAGTRVERRSQFSLHGANYLDFLPGRYRAGALVSARLVLNQPCGLWQLTRIHYERGIVVLMEQTVLPLRPSDDGPPLIVVFALPVAGGEQATLNAEKPMMVDTATKYAFLDIGAGIPAYTN